jgi:hypothetical protein
MNTKLFLLQKFNFLRDSSPDYNVILYCGALAEQERLKWKGNSSKKILWNSIL